MVPLQQPTANGAGVRDRSRPLEFGLALPMVGRTGNPQEFLTELTREVAAAERNGFGMCLIPEHHGGPDASLSDPIVTATWLLAQTDHIRIGTGVLILPLYSIPRLAEQVSTLHHASSGRFVLGVGAGYQPSDFATFGIDLAQRAHLMDSGISRLKEAWGSGELDGHPIRPVIGNASPPELYIGAWTARGIRRAAFDADGWIADPIRTLEQTAAGVRKYRELSQEAGRSGKVMIMREAWVAATDDEAAAEFGPIVEPIFRYYLRHGAFSSGHGLTKADLTIGRALSDRVLCGSPETMVDRLVTLVEMADADTVVLGLRHPHGPTHERVMEAIEVLGRQVLPAVRYCLDARQERER